MQTLTTLALSSAGSLLLWTSWGGSCDPDEACPPLLRRPIVVDTPAEVYRLSDQERRDRWSVDLSSATAMLEDVRACVAQTPAEQALYLRRDAWTLVHECPYRNATRDVFGTLRAEILRLGVERERTAGAQGAASTAAMEQGLRTITDVLDAQWALLADLGCVPAAGGRGDETLCATANGSAYAVISPRATIARLKEVRSRVDALDEATRARLDAATGTLDEATAGLFLDEGLVFQIGQELDAVRTQAEALIALTREPARQGDAELRTLHDRALVVQAVVRSLRDVLDAHMELSC